MVPVITIQVTLSTKHRNIIKGGFESGKSVKCSNRQVNSLKRRREAHSDAARLNISLNIQRNLHHNVLAENPRFHPVTDRAVFRYISPRFQPKHLLINLEPSD